jgi:hypothetical protein
VRSDRSITGIQPDRHDRLGSAAARIRCTAFWLRGTQFPLWQGDFAPIVLSLPWHFKTAIADPRRRDPSIHYEVSA